MLSNIVRRLNLACFATEVQKASSKGSSASNLTFYRDGQLVNRTAITLKKQEDIESYVIKTVQNYFRTTYKQGTNFFIKVSIAAAPSPSTDLTPSTPLKSPCRSRRIWAIPSLQRLSHPSPASNTTSPTSSRSRPSSARTIRTRLRDCRQIHRLTERGWVKGNNFINEGD